MPTHRTDPRRLCTLLSPSSLNVLALCAFTTLASCSNQPQLKSAQTSEPPPVDGKKKPPASHDASVDDDALDAGPAEQTRITTQKKQLDAGADKRDASEAEPAKTPAKKSEEPSKAKTPKKEDKSPQDAGAPRDDMHADDNTSKTEPPEETKVDECSRMRLQEKAEAYLKSMATGDTMSLHIHPSFRYTENGQQVQLGAGAWLRGGETQSSRHVIDETICSSLSQAVMSGLTGRFMLGVRLRYTEGQLLEAEAQVVPELLAQTDLDSVIPMGDDPLIADVPQDKRSSRDELFDYAHRYFDSVTGIVNLPPSAPTCRRLQNGVPLGTGTCTEPPGNARFEQQRFDLADEPNGIVTATVLYNGHVGVYLLKVSDHMLQNIVVIGGATSQATGW